MTEFRLAGSLSTGPLKLRLKELREARGLSYAQFGALAGCHISTIIRLEKGMGRPSARDIERFASALGVEPSELIADEPQHP